MSQEQSLLNALDAAGIAWSMTKHQAVYAVEESAQLHAEIPGAHTKNLFLKDAAEQFCVVSAPQHRDTGLSGADLSYSPSFKTRVTKRREASTPITFLWLVLRFGISDSFVLITLPFGD